MHDYNMLKKLVLGFEHIILQDKLIYQIKNK